MGDEGLSADRADGSHLEPSGVNTFLSEQILSHCHDFASAQGAVGEIGTVGAIGSDENAVVADLKGAKHP